MRVPVSEHTSRPWRIRAIAPDFVVEDVWDVPVQGVAGAFPDFVALLSGGDQSGDPSTGDFLDSAPARLLWELRDRLGKVLGLGELRPTTAGTPLPIPGDQDSSLTARLDEDLRHTADDVRFQGVPFTPLYRTGDEFAAELSNRTVHAVMHLAWVPRSDGIHQGRMTVYVKPRGRLGVAYLALIKPFRYAVVYPALERYLERAWRERLRRA